MNLYTARYKGREMDVQAGTSLEAQTLAAAYFKAKKRYQVDVYLIAKEGVQIVHAPQDILSGS